MNALSNLIADHITIEKMIAFLSDLMKNLKEFDNKLEPVFNIIIDFFQIYADKGHHGKEESILFEQLQSKPISEKERELINELINEHKQGRKFILELNSLKKTKELKKIEELLNKIITLYKQHIYKENAYLFPNSTAYFSKEDQVALAKDFIEVDHKMFQEKYLQTVNNLMACLYIK